MKKAGLQFTGGRKHGSRERGERLRLGDVHHRRAYEKDDLRDAVQKVKSAFRDDPANLTRRWRSTRRTSRSSPRHPSVTMNSVVRRLLSVARSGRYLRRCTTRRSLRRAELSSASTRTTRVPSSSTPSLGTTDTRCSPSATLAPGSHSVRSKTSFTPSSRARIASSSFSNR